MPALPIGENHDARTLFTDHTGNLHPVLPGVLDAAVGNVQRVTEADLEDAGGVGGFTGAVLGGAPCAHFSLRQVEDSGAQPALRHFEQRTATRLLDVIAMGSNRQDIQGWSVHSSSPHSRVTFSLTINRCAA